MSGYHPNYSDISSFFLLFVTGVFTAAFDLGIEWLLVKGIADFADGTDTKGSWKRFASIMAASVVFHLLSDPNVFKDWPHYKGNSSFG